MELQSMREALQSWIMSGPCQSPRGAFYAWLRESDEPSFEYPEITGYALTYLAHQEHSSAVIERATKAACWLTERLNAGNLTARGTHPSEDVYIFDLAMMATGLLAFGERTQQPTYRDAGLSLVNFLRAQLKRNGTLFSVYSPDSVNTIWRRQVWSIQGQAHLLKVLQCFLWACYCGMGTAIEDDVVVLLEHLADLQQPDGRFITHPDDTEVFLHPHLYAVEGLWIYASYYNHESIYNQARKALRWVWTHQLESGGFPRKFDRQSGGYGVEQSDVTAQAIRMALLLGCSFSGMPRALARLQEVSVGTENQKAVIYQPTTEIHDRNTWATFFASQALEIAAGHAITWREFV